jgi:peptide/nickel transport system substrate-binding protein
MMFTIRRRLTGLVLAGLLILMVACQGEVGGSENEVERESPVRGGTLNMLGSGDVDYMDPNVSYYSVGYLNLRMWARQLFSYPAQADATTEPVPDVAATMPTLDNGGISADGLTYTITLRDGVRWNSTPERAVVAADFVTGIKRTCNPVQPFGGLPNFKTLIDGFAPFCDGFLETGARPEAMREYLVENAVTGLRATDDRTLVFTLTQPASYFLDMLAMPAFSAAPEEWLDYAPASPELAENLLSNGPYQVDSWTPTKQIVYTRNPAWDPATDPIRQAYVDRIEVDQTLSQDSVQQQLQTGTETADLEWDVGPPTSQVPGLIAASDPNLDLGVTASSNPYLILNTVSPNNDDALSKPTVRQALMHALNRDNLIQVLGGPQVNNPLTHVLPSNIVGSEEFDLYPHDPATARSLLAEAGYADGLTLKFLYRNSTEAGRNAFQTVQQDLSAVGITVTGVPSPNADFYTRYLQVPSVAERGVWDLSLAGWGSDWYGNAAVSFFKPLFFGKASFPPVGSNYGLYASAEANELIRQATVATTEDEAARLWAAADRQVMADAVFFPITNPLDVNYHAEQVRNAVYIPAFQNFDPTNVWLSEGQQGG